MEVNQFTNVSDPSFQAYIQSKLGDKNYALPGDIDRDEYIVGCSGGADSTVLCILLCTLFPSVNFKLAFTDTKAEDPEIYPALDRLEAFIGRKIERVEPEKGLYELVDSYNGFLPSGQKRWCTRELKLVPFKRWMEQFTGKQKYLFVGIRNDENERVAFTIDECETEMPFVDLGLAREDIFEILSATTGIPRFYERRTRSGCSVCFFQRRSELVGLLQYQPIEFHRGKKYEKLNDVDLKTHIATVPLWKETGIADNWLGLPLPTTDTLIKGSRPKKVSQSLFGKNDGIFVAAEFFFDGMLSYHEFVWKQRVVSYSPTLWGIKQQVNDRFQHLLATSEVHDMDNDDIRNKVRFGIYYIEVDSEAFNPKKSRESYSWKSDDSFAQIEHIVSVVTRALQAHELANLAKRKVKINTVKQEWQEGAIVGLAHIKEPVGTVVNASWYVPREEVAELSDEEMITSIPCPMCSI